MKAAVLLLRQLLGPLYHISHLQWTWWMAKAQGSWMLSIRARSLFCTNGCLLLVFDVHSEYRKRPCITLSYLLTFLFPFLRPSWVMCLNSSVPIKASNRLWSCWKPTGAILTLGTAAVILRMDVEGSSTCIISVSFWQGIRYSSSALTQLALPVWLAAAVSHLALWVMDHAKK